MIHKADNELKKSWGQVFEALPLDSKIALRFALLELRKDALLRSKHCWNKHKAPMALYWKVVGVYAGHLARSFKVNELPNVEREDDISQWANIQEEENLVYRNESIRGRFEYDGE